ncbi:DUF11 domain-containing protein [Acinetobacter terrae]|nr:DUF11 domain-containing protein [Acinetobacter terrae]
MKKAMCRKILAISMLMAAINTQVYAVADVNLSTKVIQRSFVNLGFETVPDPKWRNTDKTSKYCYDYTGLNGSGSHTGSWTQGHCLFDQRGVLGWRTTASTKDGDKAEISRREIEFWKYGGWDGIAAYNGTYYAELNAHEPASLYQNVCVSDQDKMTWSLRHAVRKDVTKEKIKFFISDEIVDPIQNGGTANAISVTGKQYFSNDQGQTEFSSDSSYLKKWKEHKQSTAVALKTFLNGATAKVKAFGFEGVGTGEEGNWLDDIKLNLKPAIEFSADSGAVLENATGNLHSVDFNIVGLVNSDIEVAFVIDNTIINNPAQYGKDYKIYDNSSAQPIEIIPTPDPNNPKILRFKYKIKYNSALKYDSGVTIKGLAIQVFNNSDKEGNRVIPFELDKTQTSIAVMDLSDCGGRVFEGFQYEIQDDDVDLGVTKQLIDKVALPNTAVSYEITLLNDSQATANNVVLKDQLLANLTQDQTTSLVCEAIENEGKTATCPVFTSATDAASKLFSTTGLALGNVSGKAKFKFILSNLKVSASDTGAGENIGYIANKAEVSTTSNDINLNNNNAIAKNLYAAKNDLFNTDVTKTGTGLFVIDNNGQALWTKPSQENKAYFPLTIKNEAKLAQDYQLYASSTAIAPTFSTSGYSTLVKSGINSFTSGLKIEFYKVDATLCKAGISSQQVTQLNVAANTTDQVCAVITVYPSTTATTNIWFAIESLQSGLGDVILDAVTPQPQKRLLELTNDQAAQVGVGGTYVFLHRLMNYGVENETKVKVSINPVNGKDGFLFTLFLDKNGNDTLDASDTLLSDIETELSNIIEPNKSVTLLIKVEAPATATNGMSSQVKLIVKPDNTEKEISLVDLSNTDLITVSPNQLRILKSQLKVENCNMTDALAVISATYTVQNENLKPNQCLIYRIMVKNTGSAVLSNVVINDMYPAYTTQWARVGILPIVGSDGQNITDSTNNKIEDDGTAKIKAILKELLSQQEKSLYFGIKMK